MPPTVDAAAQKIHTLVGDDQGFLGTDRSDHMHEVRDLLGQYGPADEDRIIAKLSDADLKALAGGAGHDGFWGRQGLDEGEKKDLFNNFARNLDGRQLGRVAAAFSDRGDVKSLADSVATFASAPEKAAFVKSIAGAATDGDSDFETHFGMVSLETGDKEAQAIGQVLSSMKNDPKTFDQAINDLSADQLAAVVQGGEGEVRSSQPSGGETNVTFTTFDPAGLKSLLEAAGASQDAGVKAKVFAAASKAIGDIRGSDTMMQPNPSAGGAAKVVADAMTKLLDGDTRGIVNRLNGRDVGGHALTTYLQEKIRENPAARNPEIGRQITQLQGAGTGMNGARFIDVAEKAAPNGDNFYRNAQNLGYYVGAMQAAINKMNSDAKTKGDILSNVFTTTVSVAAASNPALTVPARMGVQFANGLTKEIVRAVVDGVSTSGKGLRDALTELALPREPNQEERSRGPADATFEGAANTVVLSNQ
jgi:hypothetical protein